MRNNTASVPIARWNLTIFALLLCVLVGAVTPSDAAMVREPYLQLVTPTSMTIVWRTDLNSADNSRVQFGTTFGSLNQTATGTAITRSGLNVKDHIVTITGLSAATKYFYNVGTGTDGTQGGGTNQHLFITAPTVGSSTPFRAWVLGDSGDAGADQQRVRDAMLTETASNPPAPHLILHMGDIAYERGTDLEFTRNHFVVYENILRHTPLWPTLGNHEALSVNTSLGVGPYYDAHVLPTNGQAGGIASGTEAYYSFNYANAHFIVLDSMDSSRATGSAMLTWLQNDLASTTQDWVIAYWHHPAYSKGGHNSDSATDSSGRMVDMRERVLPILEAGGVDVVLAGHSHAYERSYLIDGAYGYGTSPNFATPSFNTLQADGHILNSGDGDPSGNGPYVKSPGGISHDGTVYVVAGHGGHGLSNNATGQHPVMKVFDLAFGSVLLDINGSTLTMRNLRASGAFTDKVAIQKTSSPEPPPPSSLTISNLTVASGKTYVVPASGLAAGGLVYIDRSYTFTTVPSSLLGAAYIRTANDDKHATTTNFLSFTVNIPATVYVGHDVRISPKPAWLGTFTDTGQNLVTSDTTLRVFARSFAAGTVTLGGNSGSSSMYSVVVKPQEGGGTSDTTPPTVSLTAPANGATVSGTTTVSATASDNIGVAGVQFRLNGNPLGAEDTSAPFSFAWDTTTTANSSHTLTAVARDAAGNSTTSSPITVTVSNAGSPPPSSLTISNLTVASGKTYVVPASGLAAGGVVYIDRSYTFTTVPSNLQGATYIRTANNDKNATTTNFLSFNVNQPATVYVAHDTRISPKPAWLGTFTDTGQNLVTSDTTLRVFARSFAAGTVTLGGNSGSSSMYSVVVKPQEGGGTSDTTPPTVSLTAPANGATVSGTTTVSATASDNIGVAGVQFRLNGNPLGAEDTSAPFSFAWDTTTTANSSHTLTAVARDAAGNSTTSSPITVTVSNAGSPPPSSLTISNLTVASGKTYVVPASGLAAGGVVYIDRSYTFTTVPSNLQGATYIRTANNDKNATTTNFLSFNVNQPATVYVAHDTRISPKPAWLGTFTDTGQNLVTSDTTLRVFARSFAAGTVTLGGNSGSSSMYSVVVKPQEGGGTSDTTPPTVSLTAPANGATVSGTTTVSATASDNIGVAGVQFRLNGNPLGAEDTSAPFSFAWDTTTTANSSHTLTAVARDAAGNSTTSSPITVTVSNAGSPPPGGFTAYNDLAWGTGQLTSNITRITSPNGGSGLPSSGQLLDFTAGTPTPVILTVTGGEFVGDSQAVQGANPTTGDAFTLFNGKVSGQGAISYIDQAGSSLVLSFTGLDANKTYEFSYFAHRNDYGWSRASRVTISGATAFTNQSSAATDNPDTVNYPGGVLFTSPTSPSTRLPADNDNGYVARFTGINPGSDGEIVLTVSWEGTAGSEYKGKYGSAIRLVEN